MHKKHFATLVFLALVLLLTMSPASARSADAPAGLGASGVIGDQTSWLPSWFQSLVAWLGEPLSGAGHDPEVTSSWSASSETVEDSEETEEDASASEPEFGVQPMAGLVGDPDG